MSFTDDDLKKMNLHEKLMLLTKEQRNNMHDMEDLVKLYPASADLVEMLVFGGDYEGGEFDLSVGTFFFYKGNIYSLIGACMENYIDDVLKGKL